MNVKMNWDLVAFFAVLGICVAIVMGFFKGPVRFCMDTSVRGCPTGHGGAK